jgi:hypothetical protein
MQVHLLPVDAMADKAMQIAQHGMACMLMATHQLLVMV